jgi:WD40 repeat protein
MMLSALLAFVVATTAGVHIVEHARTERLVVVRDQAGPEALFVVDNDTTFSNTSKPVASELRAVRLDPQDAWTSSRVLYRSTGILDFAVDTDAGVVLVAVGGNTPGVALVPLRSTASTVNAGFVDVPGVRDVLVCGKQRFVTTFRNGTSAVFDLSGVAVDARLDRLPAPPASSPAALLTARGEVPVLSCANGILAAGGRGELLIFDGPQPSRVPRPSTIPAEEWTSGVFPLPGGDLVVWSQTSLQVVDRAGAVKASRALDSRSVEVVATPGGPRVLTNKGSWALPRLDDRRPLDVAGGVVSMLDDTRAVALWTNGLRLRRLVTPSSPTTLNQPRSIARRTDGKRFAVGDEDGSVVVFDRPQVADDWHAAEVLHDHVGEVVRLTFVPAAVAATSTDALVSVGADGFVHVYAGVPLARVRSIATDLSVERDSVAIDERRGVVAVGGSNAIAVVDVKTTNLRRLARQEEDAGLKVGALSPDGTTLAGIDDDGNVRLYALATGRHTRRIAGHHTFVAYDARGQLVPISAEQGDERGADHAALDLATGELWLSSWTGQWFGQHARAKREATWHVADFVLDGHRVITIGPDEQVTSWPRTGAGPPRVVFGTRSDAIDTLSFVDDAVAVAFERGRMRIMGPSRATRELPLPRCLVEGSEVQLDFKHLAARPVSDVNAPRVLVAATRSGEVTWNVTTGALTCPAELKLGIDAASAIAVAGFTANGRGVLVDGQEGVFVVGNEKQPFKRAKDADIEDVIVTGDDAKPIVVYAEDNGVRAVRVTDGVDVARLRGPFGRAALSPLPGGRVLLGRWPLGKTTESDVVVAVWQPGAGAPQVITRAHGWTNHQVAAPDGQHFVHSVMTIGAADEVWVRTIDGGAVRAVVTVGRVEGIAFAPDSGHIAVAGDGMVSVYDLDGKRLWAVDPRSN